MAVTHLTSQDPPKFPQEDGVEFERRRPRPAWPDSIQIDQAAIEQARRELGASADWADVVRRAQEIKAKVRHA